MKTYKESKNEVFVLLQLLLEEEWLHNGKTEIQSVFAITTGDGEDVLFVHLKDAINIEVSVG